MDDDEKIKKIENFYGIITPDGEFLEAIPYHEELAKDIIIDRFPDEWDNNKDDDGPKEFLLSKGYVWVSCKYKYIQYNRLYIANKWIERQEDKLKSMGWIISKPIIPDWAFKIISEMGLDI